VPGSGAAPPGNGWPGTRAEAGAGDPRPRAGDPRPTAGDPRPTAGDPTPTAGDPAPTARDAPAILVSNASQGCIRDQNREATPWLAVRRPKFSPTGAPATPSPPGTPGRLRCGTDRPAACASHRASPRCRTRLEQTGSARMPDASGRRIEPGACVLTYSSDNHQRTVQTPRSSLAVPTSARGARHGSTYPLRRRPVRRSEDPCDPQVTTCARVLHRAPSRALDLRLIGATTLHVIRPQRGEDRISPDAVVSGDQPVRANAVEEKFPNCRQLTIRSPVRVG
jgi:hypothetical protein